MPKFNRDWKEFYPYRKEFIKLKKKLNPTLILLCP